MLGEAKPTATARCPLYFNVEQKLWRTLGAERSTAALGPQALAPIVWLDDTLLFHANPRSLPGARQLWRADGTQSGTFLLHDSTARADAGAGRRCVFATRCSFQHWELRPDARCGS